MAKSFWVSLLCGVSLLSAAQIQPPRTSYDDDALAARPTYPAPLQSELVALRDAALQDDYAYRQVAHLTENIGPRQAGSLQAEGAVNYVADELRKLGLDVRLEEVKVRHYLRGIDTAELVQYPGQIEGTTQKIVLTALGNSTPTNSGGITAPVVAVNNADDLRALGREKVAGKIVLFNFPFDHRKAVVNEAFSAYEEAVAYRADGPKQAVQMGAIAALVRSVGDADYRLPHTGYSAPAGIPAAAVAGEDADLIGHLAAQGTVRMRLTLTSENGPEVLSHNVIADIRGSEHPEQVVIVSGHLDSWDLGRGAIDDAAGVAIAMEAAELIQRLHLKPKRTLRVIAWMDEENGGSGHNTYAKVHDEEIARHVAAIESDAGAGHPLGFQIRINPAGLPMLQPAQDVLAPVGANLIDLIRESPGADISPLAAKGVPAFGLWSDGRKYFWYHHTAADTLDKIDPQELREQGAAMAVMGYALASMAETLPR